MDPRHREICCFQLPISWKFDQPETNPIDPNRGDATHVADLIVFATAARGLVNERQHSAFQLDAEISSLATEGWSLCSVFSGMKLGLKCLCFWVIGDRVRGINASYFGNVNGIGKCNMIWKYTRRNINSEGFRSYRSVDF